MYGRFWMFLKPAGRRGCNLSCVIGQGDPSLPPEVRSGASGLKGPGPAGRPSKDRLLCGTGRTLTASGGAAAGSAPVHSLAAREPCLLECEQVSGCILADVLVFISSMENKCKVISRAERTSLVSRSSSL